MERQSKAPSRYNFVIPTSEGGILLYNAKSGAVLELAGDDALRLAKHLERPSRSIETDCLSVNLLTRLENGGFVVPVDTDEVLEIRQRYWKARGTTPMVVTLTTTQDCNLGCYYCYEERSRERLGEQDIPSILRLIRENLQKSGKTRLHIDWYGGEPLLNLRFLEQASVALQQLCSELDVFYQASVISNGTEWMEDVGSFVAKHRIKQVQISFDGMQMHHDRRRRYRDGYAPKKRISSFRRAVKLVDQLLNHTRVDLRFNIDRANKADVVPFLDFARKRGWFSRPYPAVFQPARLASYSDHSSFLRKGELTLKEFDAIRALVRNDAGSEVMVEESETPDGFPFPKTSVCAALAKDSVVIGADGLKYRCGLQVGETNRSVGTIARRSSRELPILGSLERNDTAWWEEFDPTTLPKCSECSFLPICWGGCPKKHLENDEHAVTEQSQFWRQNLPRLVAEGVGRKTPAEFVLKESDQFR